LLQNVIREQALYLLVFVSPAAFPVRIFASISYLLSIVWIDLTKDKVMADNTPANARISTNPFLEAKLNHLRDRSLGSSAVRATTAEIARILAVEATEGQRPDGKIGLIVVLRSGLGMTDAFLSHFAPDTDVVVYHIGMFREKYSLQPVEYYNKLPNNNTEIKRVYVVDPLIATGGTATAVIGILRYVFFFSFAQQSAVWSDDQSCSSIQTG
jgi:Uracil phosphoribosyltransferase